MSACAPDLTLADEGVAARVRVVEPLGPSQLVTVDIDGQMARVDVPNQQKVAPGDAIRLAMREGALRWFDKDTGLRV